MMFGVFGGLALLLAGVGLYAVISFGVTGYVALYRFVVQDDQVRVLALRHQREIGYLP